ncbi:MAG: phosphate ABC transporter substrate-binding protein [Candidatus Aminicenantes bacterium]|nr:phosphate ABC transporter substrate-binding protein [Candidatus Aminicenantes bacterium]NLH78041.1 phosphate ABC transporter substrate-binding protein [Acidobacteriota bacterium]
MRSRPAAALLALCVVLWPSCRRVGERADLTLAGSTSIQPFADKWAEIFMETHPDYGVNVQGGGSSAGIQACKSGACQIGMSSRELKADEKDLVEIVVARDGLALIVHPSNPVRGAKLAEIKQIFAGDLRTWKYLGGPDRSITVVTREEGSGTRGAFQELVMGKTRIFKGAITEDSNGTVREIVAHDPYAIGFISLGLVDGRVRALELDGAEASEENIRNGRYPLVRPFLFVSRGEPMGHAKDFIDFVLSPGGQELIKKEGLLPIK